MLTVQLLTTLIFYKYVLLIFGILHISTMVLSLYCHFEHTVDNVNTVVFITAVRKKCV